MALLLYSFLRCQNTLLKVKHKSETTKSASAAGKHEKCLIKVKTI